MDYRAGMFVYALAFLSGVVYVQQLRAVPEFFSLLLLLSGASLLALLSSFVISCKKFGLNKEITLISACIVLFILGYIYASLYAKQRLSFCIDDHFVGKDLLVSGYVSSIPLLEDEIQRFEFNIDSYQDLSSGKKHAVRVEAGSSLPKRIRLSWYYADQQVKTADTWQFEVRLKPPHGFMNPGGFDYETWLFQHGIRATGYVRKSELNQRQQNTDRFDFVRSINRVRESLNRQIDVIARRRMAEIDRQPAADSSFALIKALAIGHRSSISSKQWQVMVNTGTSHLMAISGLHVGLASLFVYLLIRRSVPAFFIKRIPAQHVALVAGMVIALIYALVAGLSVPTQRAFIMLFILSIMMLIRRNHRPVDALGFALLIVLLVDPLAVLSAGFWFSFSAVTVIFISMSSRCEATLKKQNSLTFRTKLIFVIRQWVKLQLSISVFLLPLSLFMFQQVSLISPVANFLLIPYVSFLVVPVVLLAIASCFILPGLAEMLFILAADLLDIVWPVLSYLSALPYALWVQGDVEINTLLSTSSAIFLLFYSKKLSVAISSRVLNKRYLTGVSFSLLLISILMFIPVFFNSRPQLKTGEYMLTVLDVGQGSAAVLVTRNHLLVFDAGAKFSDRLDAGSSVVIPYIRSLGIRSLDYLVISHGDADHIGGAQAIIDAYPDTVVIGQDIENLNTLNKADCLAGVKWRWDGIDFTFLSPSKADISTFSGSKRNNRSCVLHVVSGNGSVLFTGDIEKSIEQQLIKFYAEKLAAEVLIVPHHGSKTSSSTGFIRLVDPEISVFSVGYRNRYRFPAIEVSKRYARFESELMQTDKAGAITINFSEEDGIVSHSYRDMAARYWHHQPG